MKNIFKLLTILTTLAVLPAVSVAEQDSEGHRAAAKVCKTLSFETDRDKCFKLVDRAKYFDTDAVTICNSLSFETEKVKCLGSIQNKKYSAVAIANCSSKAFETDRVKCLQESGSEKTQEKAFDKSELRGLKRAVQDAIDDISDGNTASAKRKLIRLLERLEDLANSN